jgi:hypothetical protein
MRKLRWIIAFVPILSLLIFLTGCSDPNNLVFNNNGEKVPNGSGSPSGEAALLETTVNAVDDIKLIGDDDSFTVYEDAEDGSIHRWWIRPLYSGATLRNVEDDDRGSRVIEFYDNNTASLYALGNGEGEDFVSCQWDNTTQFTLEWSMKFNVNFFIYVLLETNMGYYWLCYTPVDEDLGLLEFNLYHHGLGAGAADGTWQTFRRDLRQDLADGFPDQTLIAVHYFKIRGRSAPPPPVNDSFTIGYWKNNIRKAIFLGRRKGIQVETDHLTRLLMRVNEFYESPFQGITFREAYQILSATDSDEIALLKKQLLGAELNFFNGSYLNGDRALTQQFIQTGEDMILNPGSREEVLALKDLYDCYNNNAIVMYP